MATYHGVVRSNVVVLPDDVALADGTRVEVRVSDDVAQGGDERRREELFKQELLSAGLLAEIKAPIHSPELGERTLIEVRGKPLSETIIEERR
jgi:hypothetical protein